MADEDDTGGLTPEMIRRVMQRTRDDMAKRSRTRSAPPKEERTGTCVVCGGLVVGRITREYHGDPMQMIIGPGHRRQLRTVHHEWHCEGCGLKYAFPPTDVPKDDEEVG